MGPSNKARDEDIRAAEKVGNRIAHLGWIILSGANIGVMEA